MMDGFLAAILSRNDRRSQLLRKHFVFKVIPVLNPDGVFHGYYRLDVCGVNLNRCYVDPNKEEFPVIYAVKKYADYLHAQGNLVFYLDLHAQSSKPSSFLFGNALELEKQVENELYAKLVSLGTPLFNFIYCDFSERSMYSRDPKDHHSKEGSGRVAIHKSTGLAHCYTVECNYSAGRGLVNFAQGRKAKDPSISSIYSQSSIPAYFEVGAVLSIQSLAWTLLEYYEILPLSKSSDFPSLDSVRTYVRSMILTDKTQLRMQRKGSSQCNSKTDFKRPEPGKNQSVLEKVTPRLVHHLKIVSPLLMIDKGKLPPLDRGKALAVKTRRVVSVENRLRRRGERL